MQNWFNLFPKNISLSIYVWVIMSLLPFYFIFRSNTQWEILLGIALIVIFFGAYRLSFLSIGGLLYVCVSIMMLISVGMSLFYGYVYFSLFIAFFIGNAKHKGGFISLYVVHLVLTVLASALSYFTQKELFFSQWPFLILTILGVILLPINTYNRRKRQKLEEQLSDANKKISQLLVYEERQRIARDLHDTLGQKLSLIGLKSDLAGRLINKDNNKAKGEIDDINQTARTALNEVREMLAGMRISKFSEEIKHVKQLLEVATIEVDIQGDRKLKYVPSLVEDVISMSLKETVTNIVKHSQATHCKIATTESEHETVLRIEDNGIGIGSKEHSTTGHGLNGMKERLEFVNGQLEIKSSDHGTTLIVTVPNVMQQLKQEG
ncbi:sensor histidine kinase [Allobacillus salarius]|uniref:histidine kinase n=2 Tax=Allobacillus TaxID=1400133 RepID=A0A556PPF3_9BACI|nr:sensor histidine kinase [Allobacillus salarius]TSJ66266.1 sensor histidine kinase [Allobacillus salarius]